MSLIDYVTEKMSLLSETGTEDLMKDNNLTTMLMKTMMAKVTMMMAMITPMTHI